MAKKRKKVMKSLKTVSFWELFQVAGVIGTLAALIITCVSFLYNQKADTDRRIYEMERRTDEVVSKIEHLEIAVNELKTELKAEIRKNSDLLHADLSWRYVYQQHPEWKRLVPRYNIDTRTLEFVDTQGNVRKP
jgi:hypothetical protein